jgi:hypothetical protein
LLILSRPASPAEFPAFGLLWWNAGRYAQPTRAVQGDPELSSGLSERPYVNLAIFWGQYDPDQLKPEHASQHGRFYPPTAFEPAVVVTTVPDMQKKSNPIPEELRGFTAGWTLSPQELTTLKGLGFPGLQDQAGGDGVNHGAFALARGGYFPGVATAPLLVGISVYLIARLSAAGGSRSLRARPSRC